MRRVRPPRRLPRRAASRGDRGLASSPRRGGPAAGRAAEVVSDEARRLLELLNTLVGSTFRQILWRKATELELTYAQAQVLFFVARHEGCHIGEVARAFGVTLAAVSQIVDRLEQKGLLARRSEPADRRVCALGLTPGGRALAEELRRLQTKGLETVLARLSARQRSRVIAGLAALVDAATRAPVEAADTAEGQGD